MYIRYVLPNFLTVNRVHIITFCKVYSKCRRSEDTPLLWAGLIITHVTDTTDSLFYQNNVL